MDTNHKRWTVSYSFVHGIYWSIICSTLNFAAVFLLSKHFSNVQIGLLLALTNIFAVILQPAVATFADKTQKIPLTTLLIILTSAAGLLAAGRFLASGVSGAIAVLFVFELTILLTLQPLINSLGMQLINRGIQINFSLARGIGSITFAVFCIILGNLVEQFGTDSLSVFSFSLCAALIPAILLFTKKRLPHSFTRQSIPNAEKKDMQETQADNFISFIKHNKRFMVLIGAVALTFCSHQLINYYLIQITQQIGGTAKEMGIATGIAAAIELPAMILFSIAIKKIHSGSIFKFSLFFFMIKAAMTAAASTIGILYAAQLLESCSYALFIPASIYYVNELLKKEDLIKGQAFMTSAVTLGGVAASVLGGWLLDSYGVKTMLFIGVFISVFGLLVGLCSIEKPKVKQVTSELPIK